MSFALLRVGGLVHTFPSQCPTCFWFILRCYCSLLRRVERPLVYPLPERPPTHPSHTHVRDATLFSQDPITSYATSLPLLFLHRKEPCWRAATHALYLSSVSLSPRSLTPAPLPRSLELCSARARAPDAPAPPVACPLDPAPRARQLRRSVETQGSAVHEPAICGYVSLFRRRLDFFRPSLTVRFPSTGPFGCIARPAVAVAVDGLGVGVLTGNERLSFLLPRACPVLREGRGPRAVDAVEGRHFCACLYGWFCLSCKSSPRPSDVGLVLRALAPPLELIRGFCPTCMNAGLDGVVPDGPAGPGLAGVLVHGNLNLQWEKMGETVWCPLRTVRSNAQCPLLYVPRPLLNTLSFCLGLVGVK